jgi:hypothetical protein
MRVLKSATAFSGSHARYCVQREHRTHPSISTSVALLTSGLEILTLRMLASTMRWSVQMLSARREESVRPRRRHPPRPRGTHRGT